MPDIELYELSNLLKNCDSIGDAVALAVHKLNEVDDLAKVRHYLLTTLKGVKALNDYNKKAMTDSKAEYIERLLTPFILEIDNQTKG